MKNLYKSIKIYLTEMSIKRKYLLEDLRIATNRINEHLLKCLLIQNETNNLNHWSKEIYSFLFRVPKLKNDKGFPDEKTLSEGTLDYINDSLPQQIDVMIKSINSDENTNIIEYNKQAIYDCIIDYYKWLIPILSKEGIVELDAVKQKINELINKYNKLNK